MRQGGCAQSVLTVLMQVSDGFWCAHAVCSKCAHRGRRGAAVLSQLKALTDDGEVPRVVPGDPLRLHHEVGLLDHHEP